MKRAKGGVHTADDGAPDSLPGDKSNFRCVYMVMRWRNKLASCADLPEHKVLLPDRKQLGELVRGATVHQPCLTLTLLDLAYLSPMLHGMSVCSGPSCMHVGGQLHKARGVQASAALRNRAWYKTHEADEFEPDSLLKAASCMYEARMRAFNAVDFDEMLTLAHDMLTRPGGEALTLARRRWRHLLVDEFQVRRFGSSISKQLACSSSFLVW